MPLQRLGNRCHFSLPPTHKILLGAVGPALSLVGPARRLESQWGQSGGRAEEREPLCSVIEMEALPRTVTPAGATPLGKAQGCRPRPCPLEDYRTALHSGEEREPNLVRANAWSLRLMKMLWKQGFALRFILLFLPLLYSPRSTWEFLNKNIVLQRLNYS